MFVMFGSFMRGFCTVMIMISTLQGWLGTKQFIEHIRERWVELPWWAGSQLLLWGCVLEWWCEKRHLKGEYRPLWLRIANFFRWLFGRPMTRVFEARTNIITHSQQINHGDWNEPNGS